MRLLLKEKIVEMEDINKGPMRPVPISVKQYRLILFLFLLYLFCASRAQAQFVIPDVNFRNCLKATYPQVFDANDGVIIEEALKVTTISCVGKGVQSIEGIEYFQNAEVLDFEGNAIQVLPGLSSLTRLKVLDFPANKLTSIPDLSFNTELTILNFSGNQLTAFPDITNNLKLMKLLFQANRIESLPGLSAHTSINEIQVGYNPLKSLPDLAANTDLVNLGIHVTDLPSFPDLSHNVRLVSLSFAGNHFGVFPDLSNNVALESINCGGNDLAVIPDLGGLPNLTYFDCSGGNLVSLPDLSKNPKLKRVICFSNDLVQLPDLSKCLQLEALECSSNKLTSLPDLSNNTKLARLECFYNDLTSLPALTNTKIGSAPESVLDAAYNKLTFEDLLLPASFPTFSHLRYTPQGKFSANTSRTVVSGSTVTIDLDIDDGITSNVYTWYKNDVVIGTTSSNVFTINGVTVSAAGNYRATVTNPGVPGLMLESGITTLHVDPAVESIPDQNFKACLRETYPQLFNSDGALIVSEAKKIKSINCNQKGIQSIEGIGYFENAEYLSFNSNQLQQIADISALGSLRSLTCENNQITTSPDLSGNPWLQDLNLAINQIAVFPDLANNPLINMLTMSANQLTSVPDLSALHSLSYLSVNINPLQNLPDLSANASLSLLDITETQLPAFPDLSQNTNLEVLYFGNNPQFNNFPDLSANTKLYSVNCSFNGLTSIPDLSFLTELQYFECYDNNLSTLPDLSKNPKLKYLQCGLNDLVELPDLSKCPLLAFLDCRSNKLTSLPDLSSSAQLVNLVCSDNKLTSLPDLSGTQIGKVVGSHFSAQHNQLTFKDFVPVVSQPNFDHLMYAPQEKISADASRMLPMGASFTVDLDIDDNVTSNVYTWYKDNVVIATASSNVFTIAHLKVSDAGSYRVTVTNPGAPDLTLESGITTLTIDATLGWIPDDSFRACLKATYPHIFTSDDALILAEAQGITHIDCVQKGIRNVEGIGYFTNVAWVNLSGNQIQAFPDITGLTKLRDLQVLNNQLTTCPDLSGNTALEWINFSNNQISAFPDISSNLKLQTIAFTSNQIQELPDLSAHPFLASLWVGNNPVQNIPDLSHNTNLLELNISKTQITTFPDLTHNTALRVLFFGNNPQLPGFPDLTSNTDLIFVDCSSNGLTAIPDLDALTQLTHFNCSGNNLESLPDLSKNINLIDLNCAGNALSQLPDLSTCTQLKDLFCGTNNLTALPDLSNNTQLTRLICHENNLSALPDLSHTRIGKAAESTFYAPYNLLTFEDILPISGPVTAAQFEYKPQKKITANTSRSIEAGEPFVFDLAIDDHVTGNVYTWYKDDAVIATTGSNAFVIDPVQASDAGAYRATVTNPAVPGLVLESGITTLTVDMGLGWIADDNFRACLKATYPWVFNSEDYVILAEVATIKEIHCNDKGIKDISGIEYFINAENVYLQKNQISDISMLPALTKVYRLYFDENNISAIPDMSACPVLQELHFSQNNFSIFPDATANTNMKVLDFRNNHIASVPVLSAYQNLRVFSIGFNPITEFPDLSGLPLLYSVEFAGTDLSAFPDLSGIGKLSSITFGHNPQFSTWPANFPATAGLTHIDCENNGLAVIPSLSIYPRLNHLNVAGNRLTEIPGMSSLTELFVLICNDNKLTTLGSFSTTRLQVVLAHNNELTSLPDLSGTRLGSPAYSNLLTIYGNHLTMEDLLPAIKGKTYDELIYAPQTITGVDQVITKDKNQPFTIDINIDDAVANNVYTWYKDGVQVATTSVNNLTINSVQAAHAGIYTCVITNPDLPALEITWGKTTLEVNTTAPPWTPVAGGVGNHIVVIPADLTAELYGTAILPGDYIGIFFKDDQAVAQLSGSARWNGSGTAITVWSKSDQGPKNGFAAGEEMTVMVWKASEQQSYTMSATYDARAPYTDQGNFRTDGFSKIVSLKVAPVCQRINLHNGWNLVSTYVAANDLSMAGIFGNSSGIVVKDASGKILYAPEFGITSGTWNTAEGYMVYSSTGQFFEVCGRPIDPVTPIALVKKAYPAFLPYYGNVEIAAGEGLKGLGMNYSYAQTIIYSGGNAQAYNYIPAHVIDPPIDQIGTMKPGLAYKILLQNSVPAFSYPARISSAGGRLRGDTAAIAALQYYGTVKPHTLNNAVLVIPDDLFGGTLSAGDEVGVFNSAGDMIGSVAYNGMPMVVTLWEHETSVAEDRFTVRLWNAERMQERHVDLSYAGGAEGKFIPNTLLVANAAQVRDGEFSATVRVFPNPARKDVQFSVRTARSGVVSIVLYDMMGRERGTLFNDVLPAGEHQQTVDLSAFPSGQYIYKVSADNKVTSDKLMIIK